MDLPAKFKAIAGKMARPKPVEGAGASSHARFREGELLRMT